MKNSLVRHAAVPVLLTLSFLTTSAWALTSPSPMAPESRAAEYAQNHAKSHEDYVERRINRLYSQLKITLEQAPQWSAFAQTMRDNAKRIDDAFKARAEKLPTMNAEESLNSYAELAQMHAENMQKLSTSFNALYATMSEPQKQIADKLFRKPYRHARDHGRREHGARKPAMAPKQ